MIWFDAGQAVKDGTWLAEDQLPATANSLMAPR
jgi:hypothetical protein